MTFLIASDKPSTLWERVEINTLAELEAFALGGYGVISINYVEIDDFGDRLKFPAIRKVTNERR